MSRGGAQRTVEALPTGGTPVWVWVVYALGILSATVFAISALFVAGAFVASDDVPVSLRVSVLPIVVWGALMALALGTMLWRRRPGR